MGLDFLVAASTFVINPALFGKVPYDADKDFDPVTLAVTTPMVLPTAYGRIGDTLYDAGVRSRLERLRARLTVA